VVDAPDAAAMGARGRARVEASSTLDAMIRAVERVYSVALQERHVVTA
jgi:hypothetical protein